MPAATYTRQVIRDATSTLHFQNITVHANSQYPSGRPARNPRTSPPRSSSRGGDVVAAG
jgi:hypothetical protein